MSIDSKKIEKISTNIIISGGILYILLMLKWGTFLAYLASFTAFFLGAILLLIPTYNFTWRTKNITFKRKRIYNTISKSLFGILAAGCLYYVIIPYFLDLNNYIKKDYSYEIGQIRNISSSQNSKGHTWRCSVEINSKTIRFARISYDSKKYIESLQKGGNIVEIAYLPHSRLGISIN